MEPIHIFSDVICPWCFVGRARLGRAIKELGVAPSIEWHPFELNPDMPAQGADRLEYLVEKFGGEDALELADERLGLLARQEGIPFDFQAMKRLPNTFQAHRLIAYARTWDKSDEVANLLFRANFMQGKDVGELEVLVEAGLGAGLEAGAVRRHLLGGDGIAELRAEEDEARRMGLRGVPYYIINEQRFYGAQEMETFLSALRAAAP